MVLEILGTEVTCPHCGVNQYVQVNAVECWERYFLEKARGE